MMKRFIKILFLLLLLVAAGVLVAPSFINWNKHKDTLIAQLQPYVQREITVAGDVDFSILPNPQISLRDVSIASVKGATEPSLLKLNSLEAKIRLKPLLEGRIEIESIHLNEPALTLEVLADGTASWQGVFSREQDGATPVPAIGSKADAISLGNVTLRKGHIRYVQQAAGIDTSLENLSLTVAAPSLRGPYKISGGLQYRQIPVNLEITTAKGMAGQPVSFDMLLQPIEKLPQVRTVGQLSLRGGIGFEGTLSVEQGTLASLFENPLMNAPDFMRDIANLNADMSVSAGVLALKNIDATIGKNGKLSGDVTWRATQKRKPMVTATLAGQGLTLSKVKGDFIPVPETFDADLILSGKNIVWQGMKIPSGKIAAKTRQAEWDVTSARMDLPGKSVINLSGTTTPAQKMATWQVDATSAQAAQLFKFLPPEKSGLTALLGQHDFAQKLSLKGSLDVRADKISLYNFNAVVEDTGKVSGVINLLPQAVQARLNIAEMPTVNWTADARRDLGAWVLRDGTDVELSISQWQQDKLPLSDVVFKGRSDAKGLNISTLTAKIGESGHLSLSGRITGETLATATGMDIAYDLSTPDMAALAVAGSFVWSAPLQSAKPAALKGTLRLFENNYTHTTAGSFFGGTVKLDARAPRPEGDAAAAWQSRMTLSLPDSANVFGLFGIPLDRLVNASGKVDFEADYQDQSGGFTLSGIRAVTATSTTTGQATVTPDSVRAALNTTQADADRWLSSEWQMPRKLNLSLKADTLRWRDNAFASADMEMVATDKAIEISHFTGRLWDGNVSARSAAKRDGKNWAGTMSGKISGAKLGLLAGLMGMEGFTLGEGDAVFDFKTDGKPDAPMFHDVSGTLSLSADSVTVDRFDPAGLAAFITDAQGEMPAELSTTLHRILRAEPASYNDVAADLSLAAGQFKIENLSLENADSSLRVQGTYDIGPNKYDLSATMTLKALPDLGALTVTRAGDLKTAPDYRLDTKPVSDWLAQKIAPPVTEAPAEVIPEVLPENLPSDFSSRLDDGTNVDVMPMPPPEDDDVILMPSNPDNTVETETLAPPPVTDAPAPEDGTQDSIRGILDRLENVPEDTAPEPAESDILPPE